MLKVGEGRNGLWDGLSDMLRSTSSRAEDIARRATSKDASKGKVEDALELVQAAKENANAETMRTWDKHTDMVEKSQKLRETRARQKAIERRDQERREDHTELMAKIAIENANRAQMFDVQAQERQAKRMTLAA